MKLKSLIIPTVLVFLSACSQKTDLSPKIFDLIIGNWTYIEYQDSLVVLKKTSSIADDEYSFAINSNGKFEENKNSGFCGTPPISYKKYDGTWTAISDSLLEVNVGYWGGEMTYQMKIISISKDELIVYQSY